MPLSSLERFFTRASPALTSTILFQLTRPELNNLTQTNLLIHTIIDRYILDAWNITTFLQPWFPNRTGDFRIELARTGAVVTGSQVLRFFDRQPPDPSCDLDVITRVGGVLDLSMYLESQGYRRRYREPKLSEGSRREDDEYPILTSSFSLASSWQFITGGGRTGIVDIVDYVKVQTVEQEETVTHKVQVIVVLQPPIEHILYGFHSTGVINFFDHKEAVSVFPHDTFISRVFRVCSREALGPEWSRPWVEKYTRRGFHIDTTVDDPPYPVGKRHVKDRYCWVIPFRNCPCGELDEEFSECRSRGRYYAEDYESIGFDIIPLYEGGKKGYERRYRIAIQEPDLWFYIWPWYTRH